MQLVILVRETGRIRDEVVINATEDYMVEFKAFNGGHRTGEQAERIDFMNIFACNINWAETKGS